jgi:hypothetical protein
MACRCSPRISVFMRLMHTQFLKILQMTLATLTALRHRQ